MHPAKGIRLLSEVPNFRGRKRHIDYDVFSVMYTYIDQTYISPSPSQKHNNLFLETMHMYMWKPSTLKKRTNIGNNEMITKHGSK